MLVRALTMMYDSMVSEKDVSDELEISVKGLRSIGFPPWTVRVTLPNEVSPSLIQRLCGSEYLFSAYHGSVSDVKYEGLREIMKCGNSFAALLLSEWGEVSKASELLVRLVMDLGFEVAVRIGFSIGSYVETPYYPLSTSRRYGASIALRYADTALQAFRESVSLSEAFRRLGETLKNVDSVVGSTFRNLGIPYLGIDLSLSPWMEESVVPLIEHVSGVSFPRTGSAWGLKTLNNMLTNIAETYNIKTLGFNEVMLPVGEDNTLMRLVREGSLRLPHLTFLTAYCLVGVDMVALPGGREEVENVLKDALAAHEVKKKTLGVRVIPSFNEREVTIPRFGSIPVISA